VTFEVAFVRLDGEVRIVLKSEFEEYLAPSAVGVAAPAIGT